MYSKYHGCGNDFILGQYQEGIDYSNLAKKICNRYTGIGADGILIAKKNKNYEMIFYNADGSRAPMCGNGIRCFCAYLNDEKLLDGDIYTIDTLSGTREIEYKNGLYKVNMGKPNYLAESVGIKNKKYFIDQIMEYNNVKYKCTALFLTTDHLVIEVEDLNISDEVANFLGANKLFTKGINVNFVKVINEKEMYIRTFERGAGWTKACGSGSSSCFAVLFNQKKLKNEAVARFEFGELRFQNDNENIIMIGPAQKIATNINFFV